MNKPNPVPADLSRGTFRASFSLPRQLARDIADVAKVLNVTQSALLSELLTEPVRQLAHVCSLVRARDAAEGYQIAKRYHGQSVDVVRRAVQDALARAKDLGQLPL